jgi:hypothetical protein
VVAGAVVGSTDGAGSATSSWSPRPGSGPGALSGGSTQDAAAACTSGRVAPPSVRR